MKQLSTAEAREQFSEVINRAAFGKERVILTRRGKQLAAIVPLEDLEALQRVGERPGAPVHRVTGESWEEIRKRILVPGHRESLAGLARMHARRWPAPDEDWDEAVARAAADDFLGIQED